MATGAFLPSAENAMTKTIEGVAEAPRRGAGFRLGLRWGLNGAFAGVASLTIAASLVALFSYQLIGKSLERVDDDAVPALTHALAVARETTELSAVSARVLAAQNEQQLEHATGVLEPEHAAMRLNLAALAETSVGGAAVTELQHDVDAMVASTRELTAAVHARLAARLAGKGLVRGAAAAHRAALERLAPQLDVAKFAVITGFEGLAGLPTREAVLRAVGDLDDGAVRRAETLEELRAAANEALASLAQIAVTTDKDLLLPVNERFVAARDHIRRLSASLDHSAADDELRRSFEALLAFGDPGTGILPTRRSELMAGERSLALIAANHEEAAQLAAAVSGAVQLARATAADAVAASRSSIRQSGHILFALAAFNVLAALAVGYLFVERGIVGPLTRLKDAALAIAGGDLSVEVARPGPSEIGRIAAAIEIFRQKSMSARDFDADRAGRLAAEAQRRQRIESYISAFDSTGRDLSKALAAASIEMDTTARAMSGSAQEAGQEVTNVNAAAAQAADCVRRVADATEEMSRCIHDICDKIGVSSRIAVQAADEAKRADSTMRGMAQVTARISEVVGMIRQVANQTNLLALNATIEAARAGDAGRGFAVVAGEVKELAMQTEKATQDVAAQVAAIQATAEDAGEAIRTINLTIEQMNEIAIAIAAAMTQQSAATSEIARSVQIAADSTNQVNQSIRTVDRGVAGTGMAACRVLGAAADLGQRAEALRSEIAQFLTQIRAA